MSNGGLPDPTTTNKAQAPALPEERVDNPLQNSFEIQHPGKLRQHTLELTTQRRIHVDPTDWDMGPGYARILTLEKLAEMRSELGLIVATSGGYAPAHPGHLSQIVESEKLSIQWANELGFEKATMVVIVNGDAFLERKHGRAFMDLRTRCQALAFRENIIIAPFEIENDQTVCVALDILRPHIFTKGGDRGKGSVPEEKVCTEHNIEIKYNIGLPKLWSSSDLLGDWVKFKIDGTH
jgi:glycerol-3-phosphate cytidylyltransferase-like family protein